MRLVVFHSYSEAVEVMGLRLAPATDQQLRLAAATSCELPADVPAVVAAAYLHEHLDPTIAGCRPTPRRPASDRQRTFLASLATRSIPGEPLTLPVASAWIDYFLTLRSVERLQELRLVAGDRVTRSHSWTDPSTGARRSWEDELTVSSIGSDGLVYFKGGNGQCSYPHRLSRPDTATVVS